MKEYELRCRYCNRFLQKIENSTTLHLKCGDTSCRKLRNGLDKYKVVFLSDYNDNHHEHKKNGSDILQKISDYKVQLDGANKQIELLSDKLAELDKRTKQAKDLSKELDSVTAYANQLESIIDGQG